MYFWESRETRCRSIFQKWLQSPSSPIIGGVSHNTQEVGYPAEYITAESWFDNTNALSALIEKSLRGGGDWGDYTHVTSYRQSSMGESVKIDFTSFIVWSDFLGRMVCLAVIPESHLPYTVRREIDSHESVDLDHE